MPHKKLYTCNEYTSQLVWAISPVQFIDTAWNHNIVPVIIACLASTISCISLDHVLSITRIYTGKGLELIFLFLLYLKIALVLHNISVVYKSMSVHVHMCM